MDRLSGHKLAAHRNPFRAFNGRKKQAWSWQSQLVFFCGWSEGVVLWIWFECFWFGFVVQGDLDSHKKHHMLGRWDVEKVHAVVARSTFRSQNAQSTPTSEHFSIHKVEPTLWCFFLSATCPFLEPQGFHTPAQIAQRCHLQQNKRQQSKSSCKV